MTIRIIETRGRPGLSVPGVSVTFKLTSPALAIAERGAELLSIRLGKANSRAAWLRHLLDETSTSTPFGRITAAELRETWPDDSRLETPHPVTAKLTPDHLVWLRQWEFAIQQLDWTRHLHRSETLSFLIEVYGPSTNRILEMQNALRAKPTT